jgi:hypothetical protein
MSDFEIKEVGIKEINAYINKLPEGVREVALAAVAEYMLGDDRHGFKHYPPLAGQAYLRQTPPGYVRTNDAKNSWRGYADKNTSKVVSSGIDYVKYIPRWSKYGWREWKQVALDNTKGAIRHAKAKVKEFLSRK